ncbi:MAG: YoaK family protein [Pseudomonadota bacterium]|nr:YoaK family protein [Pseudomonadota bacterium]
MKSLSRSDLTFAVCLSALAGYVDALGFLSSGGFFVSFMSGNSTRLGVGFGGASFGFAATAAALILSFTTGVMAGTVLGEISGRVRRTAVLALVALVLAGAALLHRHSPSIVVSLLMAMAMGAENAVFQRSGHSSFGITYMTGALVRIGQGAARRVLGKPSEGWLRYLGPWAGLTGGAVMGAWLGLHYAGVAFALTAPAAALLGCWAFLSDRARLKRPSA